MNNISVYIVVIKKDLSSSHQAFRRSRFVLPQTGSRGCWRKPTAFWLVEWWIYGGFMVDLYGFIVINIWNMIVSFPYIGNVIIPNDFHIFQRGRSTTNQTLFRTWNQGTTATNGLFKHFLWEHLYRGSSSAVPCIVEKLCVLWITT